MIEYPKIQTLWLRDPATKFRTLLDGQWALPEFAYLQHAEWDWYEKVDGTNIRVMWNGTAVSFGGRTDAAQLYAPLINRLQELFTPAVLAPLFSKPVCLYGEGYGAKIQKGGGNYIPDGVDFCLFDIRGADGHWFAQEALQPIADALQVRRAPLRLFGCLTSAIQWTRQGIRSQWGDFPAEGLVVRPRVELRTSRGHPLIGKIKCKDFAK